MRLELADAATARDLRTYVGRAAALGRDAAVRLQASGTVLGAYVEVLPGRGLAAEGLVLGLRAMRLARPAELDVTVPLAGLLDRFARDRGTEPSTTLPVPPTEVAPAWAGQSPPRTGWAPTGVVALDALRAAADRGVREIAEGAGASAPALALADLRARVWARPVAGVDEEGGESALPSGVAWAAYALGFLVSGPATVHRAGRWLRLTTPSGHVLGHL